MKACYRKFSSPEKILKRCFSLVVVLMVATPILLDAQTSSVSILLFKDAKTNQPIPEVQVLDTAGNSVQESNEYGLISIADTIFQGKYLIAKTPHYYPDTFRLVGKDTLRRLLNQIPEELVEGEALDDLVRRVVRSKGDKAIDYDFEGRNYIVLNSTGVLGKKQTLCLVDASGTEISRCDVPEKAKKIYRSCMGGRYLIGDDGVQRVVIEDDQIIVGMKQDLAKFLPLLDCQLKVDNEFYFRYIQSDTIGTKFLAQLKPGTPPVEFYSTIDTTLTNVFLKLHDFYADKYRNDARSAFALRERIDYVMNKPRLFQGFNVLHLKSDSLFLIDVNRKSFQYFDRFSRQLQRSVKIRFPFEKLRLMRVLKDEANERFYLHNEVGESIQTIQEINTNDGTLIGKPLRISRKWVSGVKVNNGIVYFLYQQRTNGSVPELKTVWMQPLVL